MTEPQQGEFRYVIYIVAPPDRVFAALTDPEMTRQYWARHRNVSDWKVGSKWRHEDFDDAKTVDVVGEVVENAPPRRLACTWAFPRDVGKPGKTSRVTFEVEPFRDATRLTLLHSELEPNGEMYVGVSKGWPAVLSSLKSLLETGKPLPHTMERWTEPPE